MQKMQQVILFCDIRNFMRIAQALKERLADFMQAFYVTAGDSVVEHGGRILKYIGDSLLCVFPADSVKDAVQCGRTMRRDFSTLLRRFSLGEGADLGVSISAGEVMRGLIGHDSLRLDDVFGDPVAHAALVLHFGGITLTKEAWDAVKDELQTEELPPTPLKWQAEPLRAWKIVEP